MKKRMIALIVIFFALLGGTYWTWTQLKISPKDPTVLRLALDNPIDSLDPARSYSDDSLVVSAQVLEPLYQYHYLKRPYEVQPLVAESMPTLDKKGTLITVKIKKDVFYHDHPAFKGLPRYLKAQDFVLQFKRLAMESLKSPGRSLFVDLIPGFESYGKKIQEDWKKLSTTPLEGVEAADDQTLLIHLLKPETNMIYYLALNFLSPVPWELVEFTGNRLDGDLVGTGPYKYEGFNGDYFRMEKFSRYRVDYYPSVGDRYANVQKLLDSSKEEIPFIDEVRFYVASEEQQRWDRFLKHEIDILSVPKTFIPNLYSADGNLNPELKKNNVELKHFPILANRWLAFNMRNPAIGKNEYLRRAIAYAIDYNKYVQVISQNTNLRANSILVPGISGYMPTKDFRFRQDLSLAKEYLKMAGLDKSSKIPTIVYSTRGNQKINIIEAEFIKESLEKIGLKVEIQVLDFAEFLKKGRAGELMFFTDNWFFDYPDGENILQLLVSSNFPGINKAGYSNPEVDALYQRLKETTNLDQRDKIVHRMEEIVLNDLPWIPMMYESSFVLLYPNIKNFRKSSIIRNYVKYLKIEK